MLRALALAVAALALPACHDEDELIVVNDGAEPVLIEIAWDEGDDYYGYDDHHRFVELPAGGIYKDDFGTVYDMDVLIYRKSDGLILFAADFDAEDFDDDHGDI